MATREPPGRPMVSHPNREKRGQASKELAHNGLSAANRNGDLFDALESAAGACALLAAPAGAAAIGALVATAIAGHERAAFGTERSVFDNRSEGQILLRLGLGRPELRSFARLRDSVFRPEKFGAEPAENVIHDRFRVRDLLIAGPAARLKSHMGKFVDEEF